LILIHTQKKYPYKCGEGAILSYTSVWVTHTHKERLNKVIGNKERLHHCPCPPVRGREIPHTTGTL